ncbi:MAG TPA: hypothetical protein VFB02_16200 [Bradyrhizobium sp.]|nr:hypothetical protein [Bradyrhizobium sp.]
MAAGIVEPAAGLCRTLPSSELFRLVLAYVQSTTKLTFDSPGLPMIRRFLWEGNE